MEDSAFGFRTFETRGGRFSEREADLHSQRLDQAFYPKRFIPSPARRSAGEMRLAKALGLHLLRCHIKVPSPVIFRLLTRQVC